MTKKLNIHLHVSKNNIYFNDLLKIKTLHDNLYNIYINIKQDTKGSVTSLSPLEKYILDCLVTLIRDIKDLPDFLMDDAIKDILVWAVKEELNILYQQDETCLFDILETLMGKSQVLIEKLRDWLRTPNDSFKIESHFTSHLIGAYSMCPSVTENDFILVF